MPVTPILGIVTCLVLMLSLPWENWLRLVVWLGIGFAIYFSYGVRHSVMAKSLAHEVATHGLSHAGSVDTEP